MSYLLAIPFVTLGIILIVVVFYLLADFISARVYAKISNEGPNGSGKLG